MSPGGPKTPHLSVMSNAAPDKTVRRPRPIGARPYLVLVERPQLPRMPARNIYQMSVPSMVTSAVEAGTCFVCACLPFTVAMSGIGVIFTH